MKTRDYYELLGVSRTATAQQIRAAHRAQVRRYHPDTADDGLGNPHRFAQIQEAYETLSNSDNRRRYDQKQAILDGNFTSQAGPRRPPKAPCGVCGTHIYASQLKLHLGRHYCRTCYTIRRERESRRIRVTSLHEFRWQATRFRAWVQSHIAIIAIILFALIATGTRLVNVLSNTHRDSETMREPLPAIPFNPCIVPPEYEKMNAPIDTE